MVIWRKYIEENRLKGYLVENIKFMCIHDIGHSIKLSIYLVKEIKEGKIKNTDKLQEYLADIVGKSLEELDINKFLKTDDILFIGQLLNSMKELEKHKILSCIMPSNQALVQVAVSLLDPKNTDHSKYSEEEKEFIKNLRHLITTRKADSQQTIDSIVLSIQTKEDKREEIQNKIYDILGMSQEDKGIYNYKSKFKKYNKEEPIYIENEDGKIFQLNKFPSLHMDLKEEYRYGVYVILPELKERGIHQEKINQIQNMLDKYQAQEEIEKSDDNRVCGRMNMFQVQHGGINYSTKLDQFFDEGR